MPVPNLPVPVTAPLYNSSALSIFSPSKAGKINTGIEICCGEFCVRFGGNGVDEDVLIKVLRAVTNVK